MAKKQIGIGLIGAGRIGKVHAENIAYRLPEARLVSVSDANVAAAENLAASLRVDKWCADYTEQLGDPAIQAVLICSPTDTHARIIEDAARAGKHIFCEKPIDHDLHRIDQALATVSSAAVKLQIGFNRRFDPNYFAVKRAVQQGQLGQPQIVLITSRDPAPPPIEYIKVSGGMFLDMTIHDFDMARYLIDSEVKSVYAVGGVMVDPAIGAAGDIDTAVVTLEFENGTIATINNCRRAVYGYDQRVEVFGSLGNISTENITPQRTTLSDAEGIHAPLPLNFFMQRYVESYYQEMKAFIECIVNDAPPPVSGKDGRAPVLIGLAAKLSLEQKRPVNLNEVEQTLLQKAFRGMLRETVTPDPQEAGPELTRAT